MRNTEKQNTQAPKHSKRKGGAAAPKPVEVDFKPTVLTPAPEQLYTALQEAVSLFNSENEELCSNVLEICIAMNSAGNYTDEVGKANVLNLLSNVNAFFKTVKGNVDLLHATAYTGSIYLMKD